MPSKCLLTGASGFVGSHILDYLLEKTDWTFVCPCAWKHSGSPERILQLPNYPANKDRVTVVTHDLTAPFSIQTIDQHLRGTDYILNVASESHVDRSITEPCHFISNNVELTVNMLELARELCPKIFLQFSTDEVYGVAASGLNHKEWSPIIPSNPYSASKAAQEAIAIAYWRTYGVPLIITNTMNVYGPRQDKEKFISKLISKISKSEKVTIHGTCDEDGNVTAGSRYYIDARSLADAMHFILHNVSPNKFEEGMESPVPPRYNIVGDLEIDNWQLAREVAAIMGQPLIHEFLDFHAARPGHDRRYALDGTKLAELGWKPAPFHQGIKDLIDWSLKKENSVWL